ncbi:tRNA glutamyl-Q(34) synthetase GluQRS [Pseudoalteromonas denitrificans]|uniref:Glutamyl-Q tRNA(Asp) synthetase n=1 Tax=Pseudoalteromonas denitrificans DSM 6059 TaxID=1123010 RepID=A0A1I1E3J7_9GAMM|nr:tRNA glutamyl-Q(34) synthetase GluQRS [Pseudoalteromonas denitrificans]SFB81684.1 glutamyl-Q tRNA(Asp) synthetase [Pseudoalteromonas denitrificans DSM 6059]
MNDLLSGAYRGRFAPSPSGPLHFGSLVAALASFLDAKSHLGQWLVRIEDIDTPRTVKGASDLILSTLDAYGLHWDEHITYQSAQLDFYQTHLEKLFDESQLYACQCTRKQIKALGGIYNNACRKLELPTINQAIRIKQNSPVLKFNDLIQNKVSVNTSFATEDYIIKRRDGLFAYQLVVVLDDIHQGITHIVRGADLLEPTVRQMSLFNVYNENIPLFAHVPLAVAEPGFKLSKQNYAPAIDITKPQLALFDALRFLGQAPIPELLHFKVEEIIAWAISHWDINKIPKVTEIQLIKNENNPHCQFLALKNN